MQDFFHVQIHFLDLKTNLLAPKCDSWSSFGFWPKTIECDDSNKYNGAVASCGAVYFTIFCYFISQVVTMILGK